jgi:membrane-associated phospholipid phosphatase
MALPRNRRRFLSKIASLGTAALAAAPIQSAANDGETRPERAAALRRSRAEAMRTTPVPLAETNGDEHRYANKAASFSKTLRRNSIGEVDLNSYNSMIRACESGHLADYEAILRGGSVKLKNPAGAYGFQYAGLDQSQFSIPPAPRFDSAAQAAEMVELYWQSLARDIPFSAYDANPLIAEACGELGKTPPTVFRGPAAGSLAGPYVSQFLLQPFHLGTVVCDARQTTAMPGVDYLTQWSEWFSLQIGENKGAGTRLEPNAVRYIRNGRDLAHYVHYDWSYSPFYQALWTLLGYGSGAYTENNPFAWSHSQEPYIHFGPPDAFDFVARAAKPAFQAAWWQKWMVHRRLRPEEFGGRVHQNLEQVTVYPIHSSLFASRGLRRAREKWGTALLAQAYAEGCPPHSAYPSGHATVAGACTTMLKAFFREGYAIPNPVVPSADGLRLEPWTGVALTIGGELDKLAYNIAAGRNFAGIHWRSDMEEGVKLGEAVATEVLRDLASGYDLDDFGGFQFTRVNGAVAVVSPGSDPNRS